MLNLDPNNQHDPFYRYQMPEVKIKIEGNGNGIKTVLVNLEQIGSAIMRHPEYLLKYISQYLGTMGMCKANKYIVTGEFTQNVIQQKIFDFITDFVLCGSCRNPETTFNLDNKKLYLICKACPNKTCLTKIDKTYNFILKNEKN